MLVGDLADEFLDHVLEGEDARGPAVLVGHDSHLETLLAQQIEQVVERDGLRYHGDLAEQLGHGTPARSSGGIATARLRCTSPRTSSEFSPDTGKRE